MEKFSKRNKDGRGAGFLIEKDPPANVLRKIGEKQYVLKLYEKVKNVEKTTSSTRRHQQEDKATKGRDAKSAETATKRVPKAPVLKKKKRTKSPDAVPDFNVAFDLDCK